MVCSFITTHREGNWAVTSLRFWREHLGLGDIKTSFKFGEDDTITEKAWKTAAGRLAEIDLAVATRQLGRTSVFFRTHKLYERPLLSFTAVNEDLEKLSDDSLSTVLGFDVAALSTAGTLRDLLDEDMPT